MHAATSVSTFGRALAQAALASLDATSAADAAVRIWWAEDGEPTLLFATDEETSTGWASPATRATVARDHSVRKMSSRGTDGRTVAVFPLSAGASQGVLELQAHRMAIEHATDELTVLTALSAPIPALVESRRRQAVIAGAFELGTSLSASAGTEDAARSVVRFLAASFDTPVLLWRADEGTAMHLIGQAGVPVSARAALRSLRVLPVWDPMSAEERLRQQAAVEGATGTPGEVYADEQQVLFVGGVAPAETTTAAMAAGFLAHTLGRVGNRGVWAAAERQLDLAVAVAAHEMRSPLLGVEAALGILLGRAALETDDRDLLKRSRTDVRRVLRETKHLLIPTSGGGISTRRRLDLLAVTGDAVQLVLRELDEADVHVSGQDGLIVNANAAAIRRAVTNIVRNAIVHADAGPVRVKVAREDGHALVRVSDMGPGISRQERTTMFDPFVRGSTGRRGNGSGLGLFVARRAVESNGGSLTLRSGSRGSIFTIRLPLVHLSPRRGSA
jgi:signal transduction histidine kinase